MQNRTAASTAAPPIQRTPIIADTAADRKLPALLDARTLREETGLTRAAVAAIFIKLPVIQFANLRKTYVKRCDVERLLDERTFAKDVAA